MKLTDKELAYYILEFRRRSEEFDLDPDRDWELVSTALDYLERIDVMPLVDAVDLSRAVGDGDGLDCSALPSTSVPIIMQSGGIGIGVLNSPRLWRH